MWPEGPAPSTEDSALDEAEAQLPGFFAEDADDSKDDEDYIPTISIPRGAHDDEADPSHGPASAPPPVTAAQVTQSDSLAAILQTLADQQRSFAEEQHSQPEMQNRLLAEQAHQQEAQTLLFQEMRQQQETMRQ